MPERSSKKRPTDVNQLAAFIVGATTDDEPDEPETEEQARSRAAAILGRKGGLKGGRTTAAQLTPAERSAKAKKAAEARWRPDE